jgi:ABC-type transport system involved in multi-copper enzyme maturation permease subunit
VLAVGDFFAYGILESSYKISIWVSEHTTIMFILTSCIALISIVFAIIGGKLGYKYVELQRSRLWHYRNTPYAGYSNKFENTLYWAGKFALFPIIIVMFIFLIYGIVCFSIMYK